MPTTNALSMTESLIARPSITPEDAGCQDLIAQCLTRLGFKCETMPFGKVKNLWATHGSDKQTLVFAGHTDVVPPGPIDIWDSDPFTPYHHNGYLYGRGAADMKSSLAAMLSAAEIFIQEEPQHKGRLAFLFTSDEEGPAIDGTVQVVSVLSKRGEKLDWCVLGEPSSSKKLGDIIKNGRRGSLNAKLTIKGKQGHVAYPQLATNPIHTGLHAIQALIDARWDTGNAFFDATSLQFSAIEAGTGATNVIPGALQASFNIRFSSETNAEVLMRRCESIFKKYKLNFDIHWTLSGDPFLTKPGKLVKATQSSLREIVGYEARLSTGGGTSDGRFIAKLADQVIEVGPVNATIHQRNERVLIEDIERLKLIYLGIMRRMLSQ